MRDMLAAGALFVAVAIFVVLLSLVVREPVGERDPANHVLGRVR